MTAPGNAAEPDERPAEQPAGGDQDVPDVPLVLDARGLRCPLPVIRLAELTRDARPGARVTVLWTDPAAEHDVPAWARMRGHTTLSTERHGNHGSTTVRLRDD